MTDQRDEAPHEGPQAPTVTSDLQGPRAPTVNDHEEVAATWVGSFLLTQPGKTYDIAPVEQGAAGVTRDVAVEAARALTDDVVRASASRSFPESGP